MLNEIKKYAQGLNAPQDVITWLDRRDKQRKITDQQEAEHIIDFFLSDSAPTRYVRMSYENAKQKAKEWVEQMNKKGQEVTESGSDTEVVLDFKDGFKIVKLKGENAYKREGALMRHCVASYFGKDDEIYSLRDAKNLPHCTMSKDSQQIKGKGNGAIHPKYIDYVVKFLEFTGLTVRDSEMQNLGYFVPKFHSFCINKMFKNRYLPEGTDVQYQDGFRIFTSIEEVNNFNGEYCGFNGNISIDDSTGLTEEGAKKIYAISGNLTIS